MLDNKHFVIQAKELEVFLQEMGTSNLVVLNAPALLSTEDPKAACHLQGLTAWGIGGGGGGTADLGTKTI